MATQVKQERETSSCENLDLFQHDAETMKHDLHMTLLVKPCEFPSTINEVSLPKQCLRSAMKRL